MRSSRLVRQVSQGRLVAKWRPVYVRVLSELYVHRVVDFWAIGGVICESSRIVLEQKVGRSLLRCNRIVDVECFKLAKYAAHVASRMNE